MPDTSLTSPSLPPPAQVGGTPTPPANLAPPTPPGGSNPFRSGGMGAAWTPTQPATPPTPPTPSAPQTPQVPQAPAPRPVPRPATNAPAAPAGGYMNSFTGSPIGQALSRFQTALDPEVARDALISSATADTPPLVAAGLVPRDGPVASILGGAQRLVRGNPGMFASLAGTLGGPIVKPLLSTPFGLPAMAGMYGLLAGGDSAAAARRFTAPLLSRLGLSEPTG